MSAVLVCVGDIGELIESFSAASYSFYLLSFIAVLIMRITHPNHPRPFKVLLIFPFYFRLWVISACTYSGRWKGSGCVLNKSAATPTSGWACDRFIASMQAKTYAR